MEENKQNEGIATESVNNGVIPADTENRGKTEYKRGMHPNTVAHHFTGCGNPAGRPKQTQEQRDALAMLRKAAPQAIETLIEIMGSKKARGADRLKAAEMAIQYTYGKAPQTVTVNSNNTVASEIMRELQSIRNDYKAQIDKEIEADKNCNVPQDGVPVFPPELE